MCREWTEFWPLKTELKKLNSQSAADPEALWKCPGHELWPALTGGGPREGSCLGSSPEDPRGEKAHRNLEPGSAPTTPCLHHCVVLGVPTPWQESPPRL